VIVSLRGLVQSIDRENASVVVEVGGVGLFVHCTSTVLDSLDGVGRPAHVYTHLHVREQELALYGCASDEERQLFELLLTINGVGPRIALAVLSTLSPDVLRQAVAREQAEVLDRVPGVGRKMAERMLLQLRDKLGTTLATGGTIVDDVDADVIAALTGLGYSIVEAQAAVQALPRRKDAELEDRVREALGYLAPR
jgi:Holliday junction DNA helicase RuvA